MPRATVGLAPHSGWAVLVILAEGEPAPRVLDRRRVELADSTLAAAKQPYHAAQKLALKEAEALVARCAQGAKRLAREALAQARAAATSAGSELVGGAILENAARPLPALARILASHPLLHAAEGELFRRALRDAAAEAGLPLAAVREREVIAEAARALGKGEAELARALAAMGREVGSPWQLDHKKAAAAAWMRLAAAALGRANASSRDP